MTESKIKKRPRRVIATAGKLVGGVVAMGLGALAATKAYDILNNNSVNETSHSGMGILAEILEDPTYSNDTLLARELVREQDRSTRTVTVNNPMVVPNIYHYLNFPYDKAKYPALYKHWKENPSDPLLQNLWGQVQELDEYEDTDPHEVISASAVRFPFPQPERDPMDSVFSLFAEAYGRRDGR